MSRTEIQLGARTITITITVIRTRTRTRINTKRIETKRNRTIRTKIEKKLCTDNTYWQILR